MPKKETQFDTHLIEDTGILGDDIKRTSQRTKRASMNTVTVCGTINIWPGRMNCGMDPVGCDIQKPIRTTINDLTVVIDQDQVRPFHHRERDPKRVDPESGGIHRVTKCNMASNALVKPQFTEDTEGRGQPALEILPFLVLVLEHRGLGNTLIHNDFANRVFLQ